MSKILDLVDQKFGRLTVIAFSHKDKNNHSYWLCECSCPEKTRKIINSSNLKDGSTKSCGCYRQERMRENQFIDLTGQMFGRWKVQEFSCFNKWGTASWLCECSCPNHTRKVVSGASLRNGTSTSCGCYRSEQSHKNYFMDLTGRIFGRWLVLWYVKDDKKGNSIWLCECDCENHVKKMVLGTSLKDGSSTSCGCYRKEIARQLAKKNLSGKNHWNYRDGKSNEPYPTHWTKELKEFIRNRDQHRCQYPECNYDDTRKNRKLSVHHIDGDKNNCQNENLISLCQKHHMKVENNPTFWGSYFYQITLDYIND